MQLWSRRKFFLTSLASSAVAGVGKLFGAASPVHAEVATPVATSGKRPLIISSANGLHALDKGMDILKKGGDTLDAAIAAVTVVENDPNDDSVGYGGLPNEEGEVELDASCMHGPTGRAGSVASVRRIKNVARLAKTVMEKTNHVMIVGDGARRFAVAEGFEESNLLTDHSRLIWLAWKASSSFNWRPGIDSPEWKEHVSSIFDGDAEKIAYAERVIAHPPTGTIPCMAVNENGDISATTTTSGLAWKIAGRVGDCARRAIDGRKSSAAAEKFSDGVERFGPGASGGKSGRRNGGSRESGFGIGAGSIAAGRANCGGGRGFQDGVR